MLISQVDGLALLSLSCSESKSLQSDEQSWPASPSIARRSLLNRPSPLTRSSLLTERLTLAEQLSQIAQPAPQGE